MLPCVGANVVHEQLADNRNRNVRCVQAFQLWQNSRVFSHKHSGSVNIEVINGVVKSVHALAIDSLR
jgi:hypothetical protein